jgi:hypothetical protein
MSGRKPWECMKAKWDIYGAREWYGWSVVDCSKYLDVSSDKSTDSDLAE